MIITEIWTSARSNDLWLFREIFNVTCTSPLLVAAMGHLVSIRRIFPAPKLSDSWTFVSSMLMRRVGGSRRYASSCGMQMNCHWYPNHLLTTCIRVRYNFKGMKRRWMKVAEWKKKFCVLCDEIWETYFQVTKKIFRKTQRQVESYCFYCYEIEYAVKIFHIPCTRSSLQRNSNALKCYVLQLQLENYARYPF